ncbi:uncharacterized mitochondrial protein AtMg00860-like [Cicer arietinum]|uniref:Uncharacterized protein LOC113788219 n=1 Tax=Cicer arietinum TaxID=3827 RepID=A0A3Q7XXM7_CICAR|nr:uncharacterized protein LOC113788219 [Cicer arietinum]
MVREGIVLGHRISDKGIEVDKTKVEVIEKLPPSTNEKGIRSFLGHAGFYRRFIKDFSKVAKPLINLLVKDTPFKFNEDCLNAFNNLKNKLITTPIITAPDWSLPFEIMCDTSDSAIGAVLGQRKDKLLIKSYCLTDLAALRYLFSKQEFDIEIRDKKGSENTVANHLS